jgi:PAS domain S-box-containing protein
MPELQEPPTQEAPETPPAAAQKATPPAAATPATGKPKPKEEPRTMLARLECSLRKWLGPKPISRKLTAITMLVCSVALVLSAIVFFAFDLVSQVLSTRASLASLAKVAAENSRDALLGRNARSAVVKLDSLMAYPGITGASLYREDGRPFATASRTEDSRLPAQISPGDAAGSAVGLTRFRHFERVTDGPKQLGTVAVEIGISGLWARLRIYGIITGCVLIFAGVAARLLLGRLRGMVSDPIVELATVADTVARDNNYALRAEKRSEDEVGHLVETFNNMLTEIQKRDATISEAHADLEANVLARTSQLHKEVEDRRQAEDALKDSELRYRNLFENNPMPMFVMDLETLQFVAVNNAAIRHYGYNQDAFLTLSLPMITEGAEPLAVERAFRSSAKSFDAGEWKHRKNNGEIIEVQLTAHAIVFAGKVTKIVLANDVTERNRAQRQVEEMHKQLMDASRQAGMAEVATGVLHNVGNVLNSVNVSATVLADSVRKTKAASVKKVAELLDANKTDLTAFFSNNGKGQMLPGYLTTLAQQIESEQQARIAEIEQLTKNIAHIKEIVAMQQAYAKVSGVMENFAPRTLLDEALRLASSELSRERVTVELDCPKTLPEVCVDRHKVMQILINLITNARQAMEKCPDDRKKLTVTASYDGGDRLSVTVRDTGCGIPQENLTRIFNHGFTTKESGHGFGLHSAANAAKEIGGSLTGTSEGPGHGAAFTLQLPLKEEPAAQRAA